MKTDIRQMKLTLICLSVSVAADMLAVNGSVVNLHFPRQIRLDRQVGIKDKNEREDCHYGLQHKLTT